MTLLRNSIFSYVIILALLALPSAATASARDAFLHAERGRWSDAMLHAKRAGNPLVLRIVQWNYLRHPDTHPTFSETSQFLEQNADWPARSIIQAKAEEALIDQPISREAIKAWFAANPAVSGAGKMALGLAQHEDGDTDSAGPLLREGWVDGNFDRAQESRILAAIGSHLRPQDHVARASRLVFEDQFSAAQRMINLVSGDQRRLIEARIALQTGARDAERRLNAVPAALHSDPGLMFSRLKWRADRGLESGMQELLLAAPKNPPHAKRWWKYRAWIVREALERRQHKLAVQLLAKHGLKEGEEYLDALWLSGWTKLEYLRQPDAAYKDFYTLFHAAKFPVSKSRGAYWAAKAADQNGNPRIAAEWYREASNFPTTFYGQLGLAKAGGKTALQLPAQPAFDDSEYQAFVQQPLPKAVQLLHEINQDDLAELFMKHLIDIAADGKQAAMAARLVTYSNSKRSAVRAAKQAMRRNMVLTEIGWPVRKPAATLPIEPALALAITRQESEFDPRARSSANALGLMQLLPSTARAVARKLGMGFSPERLYEPDYNMQLGSQYLAQMIDQFDGSYVMAIAAYNAGPGRVRQWQSYYGSPGHDLHNALRWIETIPFSETRNYVQRVLENLQVYRQRLAADGAAVPLRIEQDLTR